MHGDGEKSLCEEVPMVNNSILASKKRRYTFMSRVSSIDCCAKKFCHLAD